MISAFVLIDVTVDAVPEVAETIVEIDGVTEVYSVAGRYDLIARVQVARNEDLADVVTGGIDKVDGVENTETIIAFRTYSQEALDKGFSLGE